MKYKAVNELDKFNLHDAIIEKMEIKDNNMTWFLKNANVIVENSQNNNENDLCVDVKFTFENIEIKNFVWLGSETIDIDGNIIEKKGNREVKDDVAIEEIEKSVSTYCSIFGYSKEKNQEELRYSYLFTMATKQECFEFILSFKNVVAEWEDYKEKAWYIKNKI